MGFLKGSDLLLLVREWINSLGWIWRAKALRGIHPEKQFESILDRERARADRSGEEFSLIVFRVDRKANEAILLAEALARRIRATNVVGWFREEMSVLLPDTRIGRSLEAGGDIRQKIQTPTGPVACTVYSYPFHGPAAGNDGSQAAEMIDSCLK